MFPPFCSNECVYVMCNCVYDHIIPRESGMSRPEMQLNIKCKLINTIVVLFLFYDIIFMKRR